MASKVIKNKVLLLFKKDFIEAMSMFRQKGVRRDIVGLVSSLVLLGLIYGVFVYVFLAFAKLYVGTTFGDPEQAFNRVLELTTVVYGAVFLLNVLVGVKKIHSSICDGKDSDVLISQPVGAWSIFFYKLLKIYFSQVVSSALVLIPATIVIDVVSASAGGASYYLLTAFSVMLVPLISCALAALLSIPYTAVMRLIDSKFIIHLIIYVVVIGAGFFVYSMFLETLTSLLQGGSIQFVFDKKTVDVIAMVTSNLYPSNLLANMLFGVNIVPSVLITVGVAVVCGALSYFVVNRIYHKIIQQKLEGSVKVFHRNYKCKKRNVMYTLLTKELITVLRTPSYAFQYFATTVTLPFMVFVCANLLQKMMSTITILDCNFALAIFVIAMFSILTNTFCTTNISRDGKMFAMLKTMPLPVKDIVNAKLVFCMIVSVVSVLASTIVLAVAGLLVWWQAIFIFVIGLMLSFAEIAYSTKKDMKNPAFPTGDKQELTEGNSNQSAMTLIGLLVAIVSGGGAVALSAVLSIVANQITATLISMAFVTVVVGALFVWSILYLRKGLNKLYYELEM